MSRLNSRSHQSVRYRFGLAVAVLVGACDSSPTRPPIYIDAQPRDMGPRDAGDGAVTDAGDATLDTGVADSTVGDGSVQPVTCFANSPQELFRSAYLVGGQVPFGAAANVEGLFVGATVQTASSYPFFERVGVFMSQLSVVSAPVALSPGAMVMTDSLGIAPSGSGFLVAYEDAPDVGMPPEIYLRAADNYGILSGGSATRLTTTSAVEYETRIVRTSAGFALSWMDGAAGPTTAALDASGAFVASASTATAVVGMNTRLIPMEINGLAYHAYFGTDGFIHAVSTNANGAVVGAPRTISALASTSNFGVASGGATGALVYEYQGTGGRTAVQFRALSATATATVAERTLTAIDDQGQRPVVVPLAGGFLVLFRYVPSAGTPTLRVAFVTTSGDTLSTYDALGPFPSTARFALVVSPDSELYVVYDEATTLTTSGGGTLNGAAVKALRLVCQ